VLTLVAASVATANDADRRLGLSLAEEGRCGPALEVFDRVQGDPPDDAEVARMDGVCSLRLQDFRRAIARLELARSLDPLAKQVDLHLAMAYYHANQIDDAEAALIRAGAVDGDRGEFLLYSGLVAYARTDYVAAAGRLDAASQLSEAPVEPMASFFLGRAALGAEDQAQAKTAFERVIRDHPGTPWAHEAQRALDEMESAASSVPWWVTAEIGLEVDDNALLRGRGVGVPGEVSGDGDLRGFWFFDAGASFIDVAGITGGATVRFAGSEHDDLEDFDTLAPGGTFWLDRPIGDEGASLRLQYDFDAPYIGNEDPFVISHLVGASLFKPWEGGAYTILGTSVGMDDYRYDRRAFDDPDLSGLGPGGLCAPTASFCGPARNEADATDRDGVGVSASLLHHVPIDHPVELLGPAWIEGEYRYQRYWSEGSEYDHQRHQVQLGVGIQLPFEVGLRVSGRYAYAPYGNPTVFPDPKSRAIAENDGFFQTVVDLGNKDRVEHETGVRISLERAIGEHVVLTTRYSRTRNRSNADVFDYDRNLFGVSLRVALGG